MGDSASSAKFIDEECLLGDRQASAFVHTLFDIVHTWDDLIDGDIPVTAAAVSKAFRDAIVVLPNLPFYAQNYASLHPLLDAAILDWMTANTMESGGEAGSVSFVIRSSYVQILLRAAQIVGGFDHAAAIAPRVRNLIHSEGLGAYMASLGREHRRP